MVFKVTEAVDCGDGGLILEKRSGQGQHWRPTGMVSKGLDEEGGVTD